MAVVLATSGCLESKMVYTVNPDGSGKFTFDSLMAVPAPHMLGPNKVNPDPNALAKGQLEQAIRSSKGVEAWSDLSYEVAKDGRAHVQGVGYFPDVTKTSGPGGDNTIKWSKTDKGMTLEIVMKNQKKQAATKPEELTDEQAAKIAKQAQAQWPQTRMMMVAFLSNAKVDETYMLPGKLGDVEGFDKTDKGGVQLVIEGKKILEVMDKVMADDKMVAASIKAGRDPMDGPDDATMIGLLFGKGVKAFKADVTGDLKPQFDYKAEMEKAKAGQDEMIKKLGLDLTANPSPRLPVNPNNNPPPGP
jgi:hypothetical protein